MKQPPFLDEGQWAIVLTQNNGLPGKLIQWRYGCELTHCAFLTKQNGEYIVYDSDLRWFSSGTHGISWYNWKHRNRYKEMVLVSNMNWPLLVSVLGKKYDLLAWFKHLGLWKKWKKDKRSANAFTCWELVYYILGLDNWWKAKPTNFKTLKSNN